MDLGKDTISLNIEYMKKAFFLSLFALVLLQSCGTIRSTTYLDPAQSFVLGEGRHGAYTAEVQNIGEEVVNVLLTKDDKEEIVGKLAIGEKGKFNIPANATVRFENQSSEKPGTIKIFAAGDTNLSMGFQENE